MPVLRTIQARVSGDQHGPIRRLVSPEDLGRTLKPFIFLDYFNAEIEPGFGFPMHPHSGIATLTWQPGTDVRYTDTTGKNGILKAGGIEWMNAGGGAWHQGRLLGRGRVTGFQLWLAMPPIVEDGDSFGQYVPPEEVPTAKAPGALVRVLLGRLPAEGADLRSPIESHQDANVFVVELEPGALWRFAPPGGHAVAFAYGFEGEAVCQEKPIIEELAILGGEGVIVLEAPRGRVKVLLATARPHEPPLVCGPSSVHTNPASLEQGLRRIRMIGENLQRHSLGLR